MYCMLKNNFFLNTDLVCFAKLLLPQFIVTIQQLGSRLLLRNCGLHYTGCLVEVSFCICVVYSFTLTRNYIAEMFINTKVHTFIKVVRYDRFS